MNKKKDNGDRNGRIKKQGKKSIVPKSIECYRDVKLILYNYKSRRRLTCFQFPVQVGRAVGHDIFDLQELLVRVVTADDGEAEAPDALDQRGLDQLPLQFSRMLGEERLLGFCNCKEDKISKDKSLVFKQHGHLGLSLAKS